MLVYDYSAHSIAMHEVISLEKPSWPLYQEVQGACDNATLGNYVAFKKLCLWYHKLPIPATIPAHRLVVDLVRETYQSIRKLFQKGGKYARSHVCSDNGA